MPHIKVPDGLPGIVGLLAFKPSTGARLAALMHEVLRGDGPLSTSDRELIAAYVSTLDCQPYDRAAEPGPEEELLDPRLRALMRLAAVVVSGGSGVGEDLVAEVRAAGAVDEEIHDTVLLAATFCMINRYVDGLAASTRECPVDLAFSLVNPSERTE